MKITSKGQVTIPLPIRHRFGLQPGTEVEFVAENGKVVLHRRAKRSRRVPLPYAAGFRASRAFLDYRDRGGVKSSPLPDFYIGAHAETAGFTLVTHRTYFPDLKVLVPSRLE